MRQVPRACRSRNSAREVTAGRSQIDLRPFRVRLPALLGTCYPSAAATRDALVSGLFEFAGEFWAHEHLPFFRDGDRGFGETVANPEGFQLFGVGRIPAPWSFSIWVIDEVPDGIFKVC